MEINIITICTGKYSIFFDGFYNSCERYFLKNHKKKYFVFTDGNILENDSINKIYQSKLGWPYDTMMRFDMFNSIKDKLNGDYVFFFNANMIFVDYVDEEVLPSEINNYLMGVNHPGYYKSNINQFPYERRKESNFFIPYEEGKTYFQGCFNGGRTEEFINMSKCLSELINFDMNKEIIPIWHDESALNWYFKDRNPLTLNQSYAYPESSTLPFVKKIIQIDKSKFPGGHNNLRS